MASDDEVSLEKLSWCRSLLERQLLQMEEVGLKDDAQLLRNQIELLSKVFKAFRSEPQDSQVLDDLMKEQLINVEMVQQHLAKEAAENSEKPSGLSQALFEELIQKKYLAISEVKKPEKEESEKSASSQAASSDH